MRVSSTSLEMGQVHYRPAFKHGELRYSGISAGTDGRSDTNPNRIRYLAASNDGRPAMESRAEEASRACAS
jgi:hypothetical protein